MPPEERQLTAEAIKANMSRLRELRKEQLQEDRRARQLSDEWGISFQNATRIVRRERRLKQIRVSTEVGDLKKILIDIVENGL